MSPRPKKAQRRPRPTPESSGSAVAPPHQALVTAEFRGPLPLPSHLEHYEQILPGAAERILRMGEAEQAARHEQIVRKNALETLRTRWGLGAWILTLAAVIFLAYIGEPLVAAIVGTGIGLSGIGRIVRAVRRRAPSE